MRIDLREFLGGKYVRFQAFSKNTGLFLHGQRNIFVVSDKKRRCNMHEEDIEKAHAAIQ